MHRTVVGALLALLLVGPVAARADITGTAVNPAGVPIPGASVELRDANGRLADFETTDLDGAFRVTTAELQGDTPPFTLRAGKSDFCRTTDTQRAVTIGGVADGAVVATPLDVLDVCAGGLFGTTPSAGLVDPGARRIIAPPGAQTLVHVLVPSGATNLAVVLQDGTVIGTSASDDDLLIAAPAAGYDGPLALRFTASGQQRQRNMGTLTSRAIARPTPLPGPIDLEAIVDISGSMSGNDPKFLRKDAVRLLIDLARQGDRLGAVAFDDKSAPIFDLTPITGAAAQVATLKAAADKGIVNAGGTDYNAGFDLANAALTAPGVDPNRQKGIIFLTDGGHNAGAYQNGHLRFAYNASGQPWPVCAVQLGPPSSFNADDVARLKRIAGETGGQYFATTTASSLTDIYFRCFGLSTGQRTLASKVFTFKQGQTRRLGRTLPRGLGSATFFVGGAGNYTVEVRDPKGVVHTARRPRGTQFSFRVGRTFAFVKVNRPAAGHWTARLRAVKLPSPTDRARSVISAPKK
jgi:von Willebrand factor type A domain